jgi:biotin carboxyl carrier protein
MIFDVLLDGKKHRLEIQSGNGDAPARITLDGSTQAVDATLLEPGILSLLIDGKSYRVLLDARHDGRAVLLNGQRYGYAIEDPRSLRARSRHAAGGDGPQPIRAPMPGRVVRVLAKVGDVVEARQGVVVIEAMKMQNELKAPKAGRVARINVEAGGTVQAGDVLAVIE